MHDGLGFSGILTVVHSDLSSKYFHKCHSVLLFAPLCNARSLFGERRIPIIGHGARVKATRICPGGLADRTAGADRSHHFGCCSVGLLGPVKVPCCSEGPLWPMLALFAYIGASGE